MNIQSTCDTYVANTYKRFPVTLARGEGARLWDENGREYIDPVSYTHLTLPTIRLV